MIDGDDTSKAAHTPPTAQTPQTPETLPTTQTAAGAPHAEPGAPVAAVPPAPAVPPAADASEAQPTAKDADGTGQDGAPQTPQTVQPDVAPPGAKMVRRVVVSYRLGWLPGDWLQTWRRLDRVFARADLKVKATLAPLEDLPADTDILVVPPELREAAREAAVPNTPILVTPASAAAGAFADLVSRLQAGTEFTAEQVDPADRDKPKIVSYRGHTLLD